MSAEARAVLLQPAYVLHQRPYRNTSAILELLTRDFGRIGAVARGIRGQKSRLKGLLQPFFPLLVSWQGSGDLVTLTNAEGSGVPVTLSGRAALSGLYVNELLVRLLPRRDPIEAIFAEYIDVLPRLRDIADEQPALRCFEKALLQELGYGLVLEHEIATGEPLRDDLEYCYLPETGPARRGNGVAAGLVISGHSLLALARNELHDPQVLRDAKNLTRLILSQYLGDKPLKSRELFKALYQKANSPEIPPSD